MCSLHMADEVVVLSTFRSFFITTLEVNVTTKDRHYLVVKVNCSDVHYHIVVKVNTFYVTFLYSLFCALGVWRFKKIIET